MRDPEANLHVCEVKVRLRPEDKALLEALSRKLDVPRAVLARKMIRDSLNAGINSIGSGLENRRAQ